MQDSKQQIISLLERFDIEYWTSGKNVSIGSVNIKCPYCDDHSNHLGIFTDSLLFNCWKCRRKGHFSWLLAYLTDLPASTCKDLCEQEQGEEHKSALCRIKDIITKPKDFESSKRANEEVELPDFTYRLTHTFFESDESIIPLLQRFLKRRNFTIDNCIYHGCSVCIAGSFSHRLIIPIFLNGRIVSYQGADLTGKSKLKYKNCSGEINEINQFLYNYDYIQPNTRIILVEGVFDAWRLEDNVVATFGTHLTKEQKFLLRKKNPSEIVLCRDGDAYFKSRKEQIELAAYINVPIYCIALPRDEDPDSYNKIRTLQTIEEKINRQKRSLDDRSR